jgi:hypothetical protein
LWRAGELEPAADETDGDVDDLDEVNLDTRIA